MPSQTNQAESVAPIDRLRALVDGTHDALLAEVAGADAIDPALIARLRRRWPAELVSAAIDLQAARDKAKGRLDHIERLALDPVGCEQATSSDVARHKAGRFADDEASDVLDLCCGVGGDAVALAETANVTLVDRDPVRVWMARHNVTMACSRPCRAVVADVTSLKLTDRVVHIDPDRRPGGRRTWRYDDMQPGPGFIESLVAQTRAAAIKLSPGVDPAALPAGELEFITRHRTLVQAVLWTGELQQHERTATTIASTGQVNQLHGTPAPMPIGQAQAYVMTVDPAVERAGLMHLLCERHSLAATHPKLGLLTGASPVDDPFLECYERLAQMPWRLKRVKAWLDEHNAGVVDVKTRGGAVDPDRIAPALRGDGDQPFVVFIHAGHTHHTHHSNHSNRTHRISAMMTRRVEH